MATDIGDYRRQRSRSPVYKGYSARSRSRSPEKNSRGDGLLPTPSARWEPRRQRSRSRSRERHNRLECRTPSVKASTVCNDLCIRTCSHYGGGGRRRDPKEQAEIHAKKRKEREKIATRGVPDVWAASPPRPDLE